MTVAIIVGTVWLLLVLLGMMFMMGASKVNERYDRPEDTNNENYNEGDK